MNTVLLVLHTDIEAGIIFSSKLEYIPRLIEFAQYAEYMQIIWFAAQKQFMVMQHVYM